MDAALKAALAQPSPWIFGAMKMDLPGHSLRLLDGSAQLVIGGELFVGKDDAFGTIASISELAEEIGDQAPEITVTLYPPDVSAAAVLVDPNMQGSVAKFMVGAVDPQSGAVIGNPEVLFLGEVDVPSLSIDEVGARTVEYSIVSVFERLFEVEEGQRASDGWHQSIHPGELGLEFMTGTDVNLYWGAKPPQGGSTAKSGWGAVAASLAASQALKASRGQ